MDFLMVCFLVLVTIALALAIYGVSLAV